MAMAQISIIEVELWPCFGMQIVIVSKLIPEWKEVVGSSSMATSLRRFELHSHNCVQENKQTVWKEENNKQIM
jgi:hypothetical protein